MNFFCFFPHTPSPLPHHFSNGPFLRDRSIITFWGEGLGFRKGVQFSRTGLLCKSCQTILRLKQIHVSLKSRQKIHFGVSLSATKCYPYKVRRRKLSAISPTRNITCMYALTGYTFPIIYWYFCVRISFILLLIKWSEMDPNVEPQTLVETFDQANSNSIPEYMSGLS